MNKQQILTEYFGHSSFRAGQQELIDAIISDRDVLGVMPTGAGKSLCYQVPALMLTGITLVISPLISLMKDQVNSLIQSGVKAAYLNSSLTAVQYETALKNARNGQYKIIYVAPERLCTPQFLSFAKSVEISMLTVDEAHCVSQWGQDFRPSYLRIAEFVALLEKRPVISAFTATATHAVKLDIIRMLALNNAFCITTGFDRENLSFTVAHPKDKFVSALKIIERNQGKCGIIYCTTRKNVEEVCALLNAKGYTATRYHAGLSDDERRQNQDDFIYDRRQIMVATNAFGMGIDKSNVSYVIHYNMPKNLESYYQEAGRCGRDGSEGECVLLYSPKDVRTNEFLINNSNDNADADYEELEKIRKLDMNRLRQMTMYCTTTDCLRGYILKYFGETAPDHCGNCSNCCTEFEEVDITIEAQKILSCIFRLKRRNLKFGSTVVATVLRGANDAKVRDFGLNTLSTYGIMADTPVVEIKRITKFLENEGYIAQEEFSTLKLTAKAKEILFDKKNLTMKQPASKSDKAIKMVSKNEVYSIDTKLFAILKELRNKFAREAGVPAYIIFNDSTLRDMCLKLPNTEEKFLTVSGVGRQKAEKYSKSFTSAIGDYINNNPQTVSALAPADMGSNYLSRLRASRGENGGSEKLFEIIIGRQKELCASDGFFTLNQFCDDILSQLGIAADRKNLTRKIESYLIEKGYLTKNGIVVRCTKDGRDFGITEITGKTSQGRGYISVNYTPPAQQTIFENLNEILK